MLTVVQIRALQPAPRPYKVFDSDGLYLLVQPSGALLWRFRYRCCGIERKLSRGSFPEGTLQQARWSFELLGGMPQNETAFRLHDSRWLIPATLTALVVRGPTSN